MMKKLALILATAAAFGLTSAAFAQGPAASTKEQVQPAQTQSHVTHKMKTSHRRGVRNVVLVRHDRGLHRGFVHSRHYGSDNVKKVVVRHTPTNRTVKAKTAS
jgi:Ni/Co efflux regulator RcnB